uniref:Uncharacterized protein n=1 Tax=Anopheles culicifacies TaxID=139723 RepID=A0A182MPN6_9DIPT
MPGNPGPKPLKETLKVMRREDGEPCETESVPVYGKRYVMKSGGRDPAERTKGLLNSASSGARVGGYRGRSFWAAECSTFFAVVAVLLGGLVVSTVGDVFTVGYLTGSQRRPGDRVYARPGK